jgi:hypothetical protein
VLISALLTAVPSDIAVRAAIRAPAAPSDIALARVYLPYLSGVSHAGFVSTFGVSDLFAGTVREQCRCQAVVEQPWLQDSRTREEVRRRMDEWIAATRAERLVFVDMPAPYELPGLGSLRDRLSSVSESLASQGHFTRMATAGAGEATIEIYERRPGMAVPAQLTRFRVFDVLAAAFLLAFLWSIWPIIAPRRRSDT